MGVLSSDIIDMKGKMELRQWNVKATANMFLLAEEAREFVDVTDERQVGCPIGAPAGRLTIEEWLEAFGPPRSPDDSKP
jgi:hypothetical protein